MRMKKSGISPIKQQEARRFLDNMNNKDKADIREKHVFDLMCEFYVDCCQTPLSTPTEFCKMFVDKAPGYFGNERIPKRTSAINIFNKQCKNNKCETADKPDLKKFQKYAANRNLKIKMTSLTELYGCKVDKCKSVQITTVMTVKRGHSQYVASELLALFPNDIITAIPTENAVVLFLPSEKSLSILRYFAGDYNSDIKNLDDLAFEAETTEENEAMNNEILLL